MEAQLLKLIGNRYWMVFEIAIKQIGKVSLRYNFIQVYDTRWLLTTFGYTESIFERRQVVGQLGWRFTNE